MLPRTLALLATSLLAIWVAPLGVGGAAHADAPPLQQAPATHTHGDDGDDVATAPSPSDPCTYSMSSWSVQQRRAVNRNTFRTTRGALAADETDPNDPRCSVCEEDQAEIDPAALGISGVRSFRVCRHYRDRVEQALREIVADGSFEIVELTGYRPGRTRGRVVDGLRTELSNHSYGTAIDINARHNGLYNGCSVSELTAESIRGCRLSVGGAWDPVRTPRRSITRNSVVYRAFTQTVGWRWGGEIDGSMRDIMHFSLTGH